MAGEIKNFKGNRMLRRAEELDSFWAYKSEELPKDKN